MEFFSFESLNILEPRCPGCEIVLDYGVNTTYDQRKRAHFCNACRKSLNWILQFPNNHCLFFENE